jgi:hypothetical protein
MAFALLLAYTPTVSAQDVNEAGATFKERFPVEEAPAQPAPEHSAPQAAPEPAPRPAAGNKEHSATQPNGPAPVRTANTKRKRSQIVVRPPSFLDAGTEALPGERKFLDYALPPTHTAMEVVQNTGGRVGWHNSPLPGPLFPR